jgi:ABC-2 type transport system permease protein
MNLKTSYFNTTLFKANIKRFWWVAAIFFIAFLTFGILPLINEGNLDGFHVMTGISAVIAAVLPAILFSYLDFPGSVTCMHAFPIKRKAHYITNIVTIYVLILVPAVICYIIGALYYSAMLYPVNTMSPSPAIFGTMLLLLIVFVTIFASGGILGTMVTGNPIAAIAFSALFIGLPYYTEALFSTFLSTNLYGMPLYEMHTFSGLSVDKFTPYMIISFFVWLGVMLLSWLLYKNRRLETNGDIISFGFLKPVFVGCVSVFLGLVGYFYLTEIFKVESVFLILPFGILGIIIANMLAKKAFTLKGALIPGVIYIVGVTILWAVVAYDLTGYENRIPKTEDIASVRITDTDDRFVSYNGTQSEFAGKIEGTEYYYSDPLDPTELEFTDPEEIEKVRNMHKWLTENRENKTQYRFVPIEYTLKDGSTLKRRYPVNFTTDAEAVAPVYCTKQMRLNKYFIFRDFEKTINSVMIRDSRITVDGDLFEVLSGNDEKTAAIMEALKADVLSADYNTIVQYNDDVYTRILINYSRPVESEDGKPYPDTDERFSKSITIGITGAFTRTMALLKEYGLEERIIKPEQIAYAEVRFNYGEGGNSLRVDDRETLNQLYNLYTDYDYTDKTAAPLNKSIHNLDITFFDAGENALFSTSIDSYTANLPAFLIYEAEKWAASYYDENGEKEAAAVYPQEIETAESVAF